MHCANHEDTLAFFFYYPALNNFYEGQNLLIVQSN